MSSATSFVILEELCKELCNQTMKGEFFGFLQVDIDVPNELMDKLNEFCLLFIVDTILNELIPFYIKENQERIGQKTILGTRKLLGVMRAEKILLYLPLLKWYLSHELKVTTIHKYLKYESGMPSEWFPEEVSQARRNGNSNLALRKLGDTFKFKGNSFDGKMIEDLMKHLKTTFTTNEELVDE